MQQITTLLTILGSIWFFSTFALAEKSSLPLNFELLEKTEYSNEWIPAFPMELSKLEGKRLHITGFIVPYDNPETLSKLMLVKSPGGCFFCMPPLPTDVVFVRRTATDPPLKYSFESTSFEGTLHLWHSEMKEDEEAKGFFFTLDDAKVIVKK